MVQQKSIKRLNKNRIFGWKKICQFAEQKWHNAIKQRQKRIRRKMRACARARASKYYLLKWLTQKITRTLFTCTIMLTPFVWRHTFQLLVVRWCRILTQGFNLESSFFLLEKWMCVQFILIYLSRAKIVI